MSKCGTINTVEKMNKYSVLNSIDISLYLCFGDVNKIMQEIESDYEDLNIFEFVSRSEFRKYLFDRYRI